MQELRIPVLGKPDDLFFTQWLGAKFENLPNLKII
jgi:hypothetical protein